MEPTLPFIAANAPPYTWDADIKSMADLDAAAESTRADAGTSTHPTLSRADLEEADLPSVRWAARAREIDGRAAALEQAIAIARRTGVSGRAVVVLRRLGGSLCALCDALHQVIEGASAHPFGPLASRYVECALWWASQLVTSLETAIQRRAEADRDASAQSAVSFASLYALGHLDGIHDRARADEDPVVTPLHEEVMWLACSLREELGTD